MRRNGHYFFSDRKQENEGETKEAWNKFEMTNLKKKNIYEDIMVKRRKYV